MKNHAYQSLWRWLCGRIIALALGTVIVIAVCMWLRFAVQNYWIMHRMPPALREEFLRLADNPQGYGPLGKGFIAHVDIPPHIAQAWQTLRDDRLLSDALSARQLA